MNRLPRSHRRVLLVLLTGAPELGGYTIARAAMTGSGRVYLILARLEKLGWAESDWETPDFLPDRPRRRFYRLTPEGRKQALAALGLKDPQEAPNAWDQLARDVSVATAGYRDAADVLDEVRQREAGR